MYTIDKYNFSGKKVLMRVDFNVPLDNEGNITDNTRIITALPTIHKILGEGASVIIMTHLGRPKGEYKKELSVKHIIKYVEEKLATKIKFSEDYKITDNVKTLAASLQPGEIMMLENLRFNNEETEGNEKFAEQLASLGDAYVMNAFGTAHRAHASTAIIAKFFPYDKMLGYLVESEIDNIDKIIKKSKKPFTAIIGGSKVSTKIMIIESLLEKVDNLIIGGGIAFTFAKAMGGNIGNSIVEADFLEVAKNVIRKADKLGVNLHLPTDCIIADKFDENANVGHSDIFNIPDGWMGLDIGIKSATKFSEVIEKSKTILWNGPIGVFEMPSFATGTLRIAMSVARSTDKGAFSLIGGGDSIAAVNKYGLANKISYISTAGGALLEYIEGKKLPSIKAIKTSYSMDEYDFTNKKVLIRVDMNVPLDDNNNITDDTRIITALPTIHKIITDGGSVIIMTHLGRPKGIYNQKYSLKHIIPFLSQKLGKEIKFSEDYKITDTVKNMAASLQNGEVMMLENLRFNNEETDNDEIFAQELASLGDTYIMNAFGTAHRTHASTYSIAKFFPDDRMLGYLVESEINNIDKVINRGGHPFTAIIGGSKVSTKINIIESLIEKVDNLVIGGGIAFTIAKALGGKIGDSLVEDDYLETARRIIEKAKRYGVNIYMPTDCVVADRFDNDAEIQHFKIDEIPNGWMGLDIGIKSANKFSEIIEESKTILWNGPIGVFEMNNFSTGTLKVAMAVARATDKGAYSVIGGGDSIAAINKYSLAHKVSYISTAGGALLEYIEGKELPSLQAMKM